VGQRWRSYPDVVKDDLVWFEAFYSPGSALAANP
jgi:hypothetical protein